MLRVALTGGIGSGKSTVSARLAALGAFVVDADAVAREVVEPGTPALAAVVERFGPEVVTADGTLDRPALGRLVFGDRAALADLEAITHPAIWARTAEIVAAARPDAVVVHDMPLVVEKAMGAQYHLVVVVGAGEEVRLRRLVELRGMPEADARARIAAQATDEERRAAADVWLDNEGTPDALRAAVMRLWSERLEPFEANVRHGIRSRLSHPTISAPDATWPAQAARLLARVRHAVGDAAVTLDHIGSTVRARTRREGRRRPPGGRRVARGRRRPGVRRGDGGAPASCGSRGSGTTTARTARRGPSASTGRATRAGSRTCTCGRSGHRAGSGRCSSVTGCGRNPTSGRPTRR